VTVSRTFSITDQQAFAAASGDANPLHLSSTWAATVFPGKVVVHGLHALLWALDRLGLPARHSSLTATFLKPIFLDEEVVGLSDGNGVTVTRRGQAMLVARFLDTPTPLPVKRDPAHLPAEWRDRSGAVRVGADTGLRTLFPDLTSSLGMEAIRGLAGLSTVVGMECPGLHSMLSGFSVTFRSDSAPLSYDVNRFDTRFNRVEMIVTGAGLVGTIEAFSTAARVSAQTEDIVIPGIKEFAGQRPLIIGGSQGLGATTARLVAAGGGVPVVTYLSSRDAAVALQDAIAAEGGSCEIILLNVEEPDEGLSKLRALNWNGGEIYYFASPRIFRRRIERFQAEDFHDFARVYLDGFYETLSGILRLTSPAPLRVFYPSSVAVAPLEPDMLEYALAKQAGEHLCDQLMRKEPRLSILVERLPRIETRQTQSTFKVPAQSPAQTMLPLIRKVQAGDA